jgi:CsoR family transcriptional regulator, copper-sensing transcriptional repressor
MATVNPRTKAPRTPGPKLALGDAHMRTALVHRLRRAEGQLRAIQRMVADGGDCMAIANQMSAVRKALDSAYVRMTVCYMEQQIEASLGDGPQAKSAAGHVLEDIEALLGKIR